MLKRDLGPITVIGFARYATKPDIDPAEIISAARIWQKDFLAHQSGIAMHCFLGNMKGEFADIILAIDEPSFQAMVHKHSTDPSSAPMMQMLDTGSIRLTQNTLLRALKELPKEFCCIEFGTFTPKDPAAFSEADFMSASNRVEQSYLSRFKEAKSHLIGRIDKGTYSEIAFVETSGAAREICRNYVNSVDCLPLLEMFDPNSVELDFWHVLA